MAKLIQEEQLCTSIKNKLLNSIKAWKPKTYFCQGDIVLTLNNIYMECLRDGVTGSVEPNCAGIIEDGTVQWKANTQTSQPQNVDTTVVETSLDILEQFPTPKEGDLCIVQRKMPNLQELKSNTSCFIIFSIYCDDLDCDVLIKNPKTFDKLMDLKSKTTGESLLELTDTINTDYGYERYDSIETSTTIQELLYYCMAAKDKNKKHTIKNKYYIYNAQTIVKKISGKELKIDYLTYKLNVSQNNAAISYIIYINCPTNNGNEKIFGTNDLESIAGRKLYFYDTQKKRKNIYIQIDRLFNNTRDKEHLMLADVEAGMNRYKDGVTYEEYDPMEGPKSLLGWKSFSNNYVDENIKNNTIQFKTINIYKAYTGGIFNTIKNSLSVTGIESNEQIQYNAEQQIKNYIKRTFNQTQDIDLIHYTSSTTKISSYDSKGTPSNTSIPLLKDVCVSQSEVALNTPRVKYNYDNSTLTVSDYMYANNQYEIRGVKTYFKYGITIPYNFSNIKIVSNDIESLAKNFCFYSDLGVNFWPLGVNLSNYILSVDFLEIENLKYTNTNFVTDYCIYEKNRPYYYYQNIRKINFLNLEIETYIIGGSYITLPILSNTCITELTIPFNLNLFLINGSDEFQIFKDKTIPRKLQLCCPKLKRIHLTEFRISKEKKVYDEPYKTKKLTPPKEVEATYIKFKPTDKKIKRWAYVLKDGTYKIDTIFREYNLLQFVKDVLIKNSPQTRTIIFDGTSTEKQTLDMGEDRYGDKQTAEIDIGEIVVKITDDLCGIYISYASSGKLFELENDYDGYSFLGMKYDGNKFYDNSNSENCYYCIPINDFSLSFESTSTVRHETCVYMNTQHYLENDNYIATSNKQYDYSSDSISQSTATLLDFDFKLSNGDSFIQTGAQIKSYSQHPTKITNVINDEQKYIVLPLLNHKIDCSKIALCIYGNDFYAKIDKNKLGTPIPLLAEY